MAEEALIVFSTFPDMETARRIGRILIEEKLAACVNLISKVESIYQWKAEVESATEVLAVIKTVQGKYIRLEARIGELHPYELPEVMALSIQGGSLPYLNWLEQSVQ